MESEKRKIQTKIKRTEDAISELEEKITQLTNEMQKPDIASEYEQAMELSNNIAKQNNELEEQYSIWEELQSGQE